MSDTNRVQLSIKNEGTYGTPPSAATYNILRYTSESLHQETQTMESAEVRADRNIVDVMRSSFSASGDIAFEHHYGGANNGHDQLIAAALQHNPITFTPGTTITDDSISWDADTKTFTDSGNGFGSFVVGSWVWIQDAAGNFNTEGVYAKIVAKSAGTLQITSITAARGSLVAETPADFAAGDAITITMADTAKNGTLATSFAIERKYTDLTNVFAGFPGMMVDAFSMSVAANAIITGSFGMLGQKEVDLTAPYGNAYAVATTTPVMNAVDDVIDICEGGDPGFSVTAVGFQLKNNLRGRMQVGDGGAVSIGSGSCQIQGTMQAYFSTAALFAKYLSFTQSGLAWVTQDSTGKAYIWEFPAVKYSAGARPSSGQNADVIQNMSWVAKMHATEGCMIRVSRFN